MIFWFNKENYKKKKNTWWSVYVNIFIRFLVYWKLIKITWHVDEIKDLLTQYSAMTGLTCNTFSQK